MLMLVSFAKFYIVPANRSTYREAVLNIDRYQSIFLTQLQNSLQVILLCLNEPAHTQPGTEPPLRTAARKYHNLKSNAAMMQMPVLSDIATIAEQILLDAVETGLPDSVRASLVDITRRIVRESGRDPGTGPLFAPSDWDGCVQNLRAILEQKDQIG